MKWILLLDITFVLLMDVFLSYHFSNSKNQFKDKKKKKLFEKGWPSKEKEHTLKESERKRSNACLNKYC